MKSAKAKKGNIYIFQLEKKSRTFGTKFGTSKDPRARSKQIKTRSFAYADRVSDALAFIAADGLAEEIERSIKKHFTHHLVPTEWNTEEIVYPWISDALLWTIESCLENPDKTDEIAWRGANKPFSLLSPPEVTLGDQGFGNRNFGNNFLSSDDINGHLRAIGQPRVVRSPRLDSACAKDIRVTVGMDTITVAYLFEFGIDPGLRGADHSSYWLPQIDGPLRYLLFRPHERFEMGRIQVSSYKAMGGFLSGVRFTEVYAKTPFAQPKIHVTGPLGEPLGEEESKYFKEAIVMDT